MLSGYPVFLPRRLKELITEWQKEQKQAEKVRDPNCIRDAYCDSGPVSFCDPIPSY